jgi:CO/xanthine dehydrogenase FAD-binding subunit
MKPAPFEYIAPKSIDEALAVMAQYGDEAKVLAGGQSLVPAMNFRLVQPTILVDLNKIDELRYMEPLDGGGAGVGAMTTHRALEFNALIAEQVPLLAETIPNIAHPQIRARGTLGGSLVHADPAAELPVIAIALDAQIKVRSTDGERWVSAADFFEGLFMTDVQPEEIVVEVTFPAQPPRTGTSFLEIARRVGDYAMMGVASTVTLDVNGQCQHARLVYLNAGDGPVRAVESEKILEGESHSQEVFEMVAEKASQEEIDPMGNLHAGIEYQRHLARVLTVRALETAFQRAERDQ